MWIPSWFASVLSYSYFISVCWKWSESSSVPVLLHYPPIDTTCRKYLAFLFAWLALKIFVRTIRREVVTFIAMLLACRSGGWLLSIKACGRKTLDISKRSLFWEIHLVVILTIVQAVFDYQWGLYFRTFIKPELTLFFKILLRVL